MKPLCSHHLMGCDTDGHGIHIASTVAGRYGFQANMFSYTSGITKGFAPKVCWKNSDCFDSDILAAFDANVIVDVISIYQSVMDDLGLWVKENLIQLLNETPANWTPVVEGQI